MDETLSAGHQPGTGNGYPAGDGCPPAPAVHYTTAPEIVANGSRCRLGFVKSHVRDYYGVWDLVNGSIQQFPLTDEGWQEAWRAFTDQERLAAQPVPAPSMSAPPMGGPGLSLPPNPWVTASSPGPWASTRVPGRGIPFPEPPPGSHLPLPPPTKAGKRKIAGIVAAVVAGIVVAGKLGIVSLPGRTIINEQFPSSNGQWLERSDAQVQAGFLDGSYQILVRPPHLDFESIRGASDQSWSSVRVEADAKKADATTPEGAYGVACVVDARTAYLFLMDPDNGTFGVAKVQNGNGGALIQERTDLTAMNGGAGSNRIRGDCTKSLNGATSLTMYINGKQVLQASDPNGLSNFTGMGLWAFTNAGGTDVRFDNAIMKKA